jgi:Protein of unknown function (DUF2480)
MQGEIINRVQSSSLTTLDLEELYTPGERIFFDLKPFLYEELILREKDFRVALKSTEWSFYKGKHVAIGCSVDAIVPTWAYMLISISLQPFSSTIFFGTIEGLEKYLFRLSLSKIDWQQFSNAKVVVKGCSKIEVPIEIYVEVASRLKEKASSIMFGEACSTVPLYKRPNQG